jgi:hypothetical protein
MLPFPHVIVAGCSKGFIGKKSLKWKERERE